MRETVLATATSDFTVLNSHFVDRVASSPLTLRICCSLWWIQVEHEADTARTLNPTVAGLRGVGNSVGHTLLSVTQGATRESNGGGVWRPAPGCDNVHVSND